jgi:hypothetical protein
MFASIFQFLALLTRIPLAGFYLLTYRIGEPIQAQLFYSLEILDGIDNINPIDSG